MSPKSSVPIKFEEVGQGSIFHSIMELVLMFMRYCDNVATVTRNPGALRSDLTLMSDL